MTDILTSLAEPFPPDRVSWRLGSKTGDNTKGQALAYIDARDVMDRLDKVVGAANWQNRYEVHGPKTICYLSLRIDGDWITKADGAGDSDVEAEKGAMSDAFKRSAVHWGIGRYLYDLDTPWVEIEPAGRSFKIKKSEYAKLRSLLPGEPIQKPKAASRSVYSALSTGLKQCSSVADLRTFWTAKKAEIASLPPDWLRDLTTEKDDLKSLFESRLQEAAE